MISTEGLRHMSMIVAISGVNFCSFIADTRLVKYDNSLEPEIVSNSFQKIVKVNDKVLFGMAGFFPQGETITAPLGVYPNKEIITLRMAKKAVLDYLENHKSAILANRFYLVGGKDNEGKFGTYEISVNANDLSVHCVYREPSPPQFNFALSTVFPPSYCAYREIREAQISNAIAHSTRHDEMLNRIGEIIKDVSRQDFTVGNRISYLTVT